MAPYYLSVLPAGAIAAVPIEYLTVAPTESETYCLVTPLKDQTNASSPSQSYMVCGVGESMRAYVQFYKELIAFRA